MAFEAALDLVRGDGVVGAAVVSRDGTVLAAEMPTSVSKETFSIMCATIHGAGMTVSSQLQRSTPRRILLENAEGRTAIYEAGRRALLVLILDASATPDGLAETVERALQHIAREVR